MKKIIAISLCLSLVLLTSCNEKFRPFQTYFWTSSEPDHVNYLFINGNNKGLLPYLSQAPTCSDDNLKTKTLYLSLESGKYKIQVKDAQGNVKYTQAFEIKLSDHNKIISTSSDDQHGGSRNVNEGDCLIEQLYY